MIYTVSFRPKGIDELQRYPIEATDEKDAVEKVKQKVSGPVGEVNIVSVVKGNYLDRRPKHFEALSEIKDELFDAPAEVKKSFNTLTEYFAKHPDNQENIKQWSKALKIAEDALDMLKNVDAVNCILADGDPYIWEEPVDRINKIKTKLEERVKWLKSMLKSRGVK
jgi:hypothetical protein